MYSYDWDLVESTPFSKYIVCYGLPKRKFWCNNANNGAPTSPTLPSIEPWDLETKGWRILHTLRHTSSCILQQRWTKEISYIDCRPIKPLRLPLSIISQRRNFSCLRLLRTSLTVRLPTILNSVKSNPSGPIFYPTSLKTLKLVPFRITLSHQVCM